MHEDVLEVQCSRPQEAMDLLAGLPGVKEVALFGMKLHVVTESSEGIPKMISDVLPGEGFTVDLVEAIRPSMEDVFVSLIEKRDRAEQPQKEVSQ
jgi:ABC-2 type transport system ATP-binding protein